MDNKIFEAQSTLLIKEDDRGYEEFLFIALRVIKCSFNESAQLIKSRINGTGRRLNYNTFFRLKDEDIILNLPEFDIVKKESVDKYKRRTGIKPRNNTDQLLWIEVLGRAPENQREFEKLLKEHRRELILKDGQLSDKGIKDFLK